MGEVRPGGDCGSMQMVGRACKVSVLLSRLRPSGHPSVSRLLERVALGRGWYPVVRVMCLGHGVVA